MFKNIGLCALALCLASPAISQETAISAPAVSAPNAKLSIEGGLGGAQGIPTLGQGFVSGSFTFPIAQQWGVQLDATGGSVAKQFTGGAGGHIFWREPKTALIGLTGGIANVAGATFGRFGAETDIYVNNALTLSAAGGYQTGATSTRAIVNKGFYGNVGATLYPDPNLAISLGVSRTPNVFGAYASAEYQPEGWKGVSLFVNGTVAEHRQFAVRGGLVLYFGKDKSLIRRHREDDPVNLLNGPGGGVTWAGLAALQQKIIREKPGTTISTNGNCPPGKFYEPIIRLCL
jgi:hypothetical protein